MTKSKELSILFTTFFFGDSQTAANLSQQLEGLSYENAMKQVDYFSTLAGLTYDIFQRLHESQSLLQGDKPTQLGPAASIHPQWNTEEEWEKYLKNQFDFVTHFCSYLEQVSEETLDKELPSPLHGTFYRNLISDLQFCYYNLGQIVLTKKLVENEAS